MTDFKIGKRGGLVVDRDSLHASEDYKRQIEALQKFNEGKDVTDKTMTLEQVREGLQKLFNAGPGVACSAFPLAHWIETITLHLSQTAERIKEDEARDTDLTDAFYEAHPIATHPPAKPTKLEGAVREVIDGLRGYDDSAFNVWADKLTAALQENAK